MNNRTIEIAVTIDMCYPHSPIRRSYIHINSMRNVTDTWRMATFTVVLFYNNFYGNMKLEEITCSKGSTESYFANKLIIPTYAHTTA